MKQAITLLMFLLSPAAFGQVVHLDCTAKVDKILGEDLHGKSRDSVGDTKGPYLIDVDLDNGTGRIGNWSSDEFSTDPNNPEQILKIGDKSISFGIWPPSGNWGMKVNREDLSFFAMIGFGATEILEGTCVIVEEREAPKRAF